MERKTDEAKKLNEDDFDQAINSKQTVLVDFFATWCGPCQMMGPIINELADDAEGVEVYKVDIDEAPKLAEKFEVMGVPTFIIFRNGKEINRLQGIISKEQFQKEISKN